MSENPKSEDDFAIKGHIPKWLRDVIAGAVLFFAGTGVTGATLWRPGVQKDEIRAVTVEAVTEALTPVQNRLVEIEKRQTDVERVTAQYHERMAAIEKKLPTRNR